jgi:hypothetical protein
MGCGCSSYRTVSIEGLAHINPQTCAPERVLYLAKKRSQILKFFESCGLAPDSNQAVADLVGMLGRDCQGFTQSPTGGEVTAIKEHIVTLLNFQVPTVKMLNAGLELLLEIVLDRLISPTEEEHRPARQTTWPL